MFGRHTIRRGIYLGALKDRTPAAPIEILPLPERVFIPLVQHHGSPAIPLVKQGDRVLRGQMIAETNRPDSVTMHASLSGTVVSVAPYYHARGKKITAIEIENDGQDQAAPLHMLDKPWREAAQGEIVQAVIRCGIAGMGGRGIPAHIKLAPSTDKPIEILIINALGSEPMVTSGTQLFCEETERILEGALIVKKTVEAKRVILVIDKNNASIRAALAPLLQDKRFTEIEVRRVHANYPLGEEVALVHALTGRIVPAGKVPRDMGCLVFSIPTLAAIADAVVRGVPLYERIITVAGAGLGQPKNLRVRMGTPVEEILKACGVDLGAIKKIIMGGPMTGMALAERATPVIKTTTAIITLDTTTPSEQKFDCIRCSACFQVCPRRLVPTVLAHSVRAGDLDKAKSWGITQCSGCGCCTWVCPSKINLVHYIALGNYHIQQDAAAGDGRQTPRE